MKRNRKTQRQSPIKGFPEDHDLDNKKQKVNDELGNPIEIGTVVIWKVENATKAVFNVENYKDYLSISVMPSQEMPPEDIPMTQARVEMSVPFAEAGSGGSQHHAAGTAGEGGGCGDQDSGNAYHPSGIRAGDRICHAARQQAAAIIDARQKIVEGAVSMVEMALRN